MRFRSLAGGFGVLWVTTTLGAGACSVTVDTSGLDAGCDPVREKLCDGRCVPRRHPAYDCDPDGCQPCELDNARPRCDGDRCVVDACLEGFGCPDDEGCQVNLLTDSANCGACQAACLGGTECLAGVCESL